MALKMCPKIKNIKNCFMGCCIDFNRREISFFKNGKDLGVAFNNINVHDTYYPAIVLKNAEVEIIFKHAS